MRRAVQTSLCLLVLFALSTNAFAILRPRFPHRPSAPDRGQWFSIEDSNKQIGANIHIPK